MAATSSQDISNCASAPFDPVDGTSPGNWSFCYNPNKNNLTMSVNISNPDNPLEPTPKLVSTIDAKGLTDLINFVYQVNMQMQKQSKNSQSGN